MLVDQVKSRFAGNAIAEFLARSGDIQLACLAAAAAAQKVPHEIVEGRNFPLLRLDLPAGVAYCRQGRIFVGPPGAEREACDHLNGPIIRVIRDKLATNLVLRTLGYPVPEGERFAADEWDRALAWFQAGGRSVCVKPVDGSLGEKVFPGIEDLASFRAAFDTVTEDGKAVLVEEHVSFGGAASPTPNGATFRFFFIKPVVVGIRMDLPANVIGDGTSPVQALLTAKNAEKLLRTGQPAVPLDSRVRDVLRRQGFSADDIPALGQRVFLRDVSNSSQSGDSFTYPEGMHPSYAEEVAKLCNALHGLKLAAVDMMIADHSAPCRKDGYKIIEMNASPGMIHFHFPWQGKPQDIAAEIVRMLRLGF